MKLKTIFKKIYRLVPLKPQLFSIVKYFWVPPQSIYKHLYFTGVMNVKTSAGSSFKMRHYGTEIENEIFWKGLENGWERQSMKLWIHFCKESEVIFDIGANTGIYTLTAKNTNPRANIYAFEPVSRIFSKLKNNCSLNNYNIHLFENALSDQKGEQIIYESSEEFVNAATLSQHTAVAFSQGLLNKETIISSTTMDIIVESENLTKLDLIKLDVETYEPQVMAGFKKYLPIYKPTFLIEILLDEIGKKLQDVFDPLGYIYFNIDDKNDSFRQVSVLGKSDYFNYLICTKDIALKYGLIRSSLN
jgi:FkbM family methyltransferase